MSAQAIYFHSNIHLLDTFYKDLSSVTVWTLQACTLDIFVHFLVTLEFQGSSCSLMIRPFYSVKMLNTFVNMKSLYSVVTHVQKKYQVFLEHMIEH